VEKTAFCTEGGGKNKDSEWELKKRYEGWDWQEIANGMANKVKITAVEKKGRQARTM